MSAVSTDLENVIEEAAEAKTAVVFTYTKSAGSEVRELRTIYPDPEEPIRDTLRGDRIVVGHDPVRKGPRAFRLDRISQATAVIPQKVVSA